MNKMSKDKRDKLILTILAIIGVLGVLYTFVIGAQNDALNSYMNGSNKGRDQLDKAQRLIRNAPIIEQNLATNRFKLQEMQVDMSPPGAEYYTFVKVLKEFETKMDMTLVAAVATKADMVDPGLLPKFPYPATAISFTPSAHFHDIGRFIAEFENNYPYMRVAAIRLHPDTAVRGARRMPVAGEAEQSNEKLGGEIRLVNFIKPNAS